MAWTALFATLTLLATGLGVWQFLVAMWFPLHRRRPAPAAFPPVTLLKPLKGQDAATAECLRSWLTQKYPGPVQILFGVAEAQDPVCRLVESLLAAHPGAEGRLVVCPERFGANAKVSTLAQLEPLARSEIVVVSDADVRVPDDLLRQLVVVLQEPGVGLAHCFYRLVRPANLAMRLEAFALNADFWSQVLQAGCLKPIDFALGAVMATTRRRLAEIGGFRALADYLADDFQLGQRLARSGARIAFCPVVVDCLEAPLGARAVWAHQVRWARTIRVCRPWPYLFTVLADTTFWALLWWLSRPTPAVAVLAGGCVLVRMGIGFLLHWRLVGRPEAAAFFLGPFKDLIRVILWALALCGNRVTWRGDRFRVESDGRLVRLGSI